MEEKDASEQGFAPLTELLNLTGSDLERELQRIIKESPLKSKPWTEKELQILKRLKTAGVPYSIIAQKLGRSARAVGKRGQNI